MKRTNWRTMLVHAFAVAAVTLAACGHVQAQAVLAARVNGTPIPLDLVDRQFEELLGQRRLRIAQMQSPDKAKAIKREALDNLIRVELLWQEAKSSGLAVSDEEVQRAVDEARARFRSADAFVRRIERSGFTEASYREHTRKLLSGDRYAQRIVDRDVKVTDKDVAEFYEINPRLFKRAAKVTVRHILVAVPADATAEHKAQARSKIEALRARVRSGENFEQLARQHSDDVTRQWGGELDPFERGEKAKAFEDAAFALAAPGATSDIVETAAGLHLIQLEQRTPETSVPLDVARPKIREYLIGTRGKEAIDKEVEQLRGLARVEMLTPL